MNYYKRRINDLNIQLLAQIAAALVLREENERLKAKLKKVKK